MSMKKQHIRKFLIRHTLQFVQPLLWLCLMCLVAGLAYLKYEEANSATLYVQSVEREHCGIEYEDYATYIDAVTLDLNCHLTYGTTGDVVAERAEETPIGDDVLVELDDDAQIIEGKVVVRLADEELADDLETQLTEQFGEAIISIKPLFPETLLVSDRIVEYAATSSSYTQITDFLAENTEFEWYDDDAGGIKKLVEVSPTVTFSQDPLDMLDDQSYTDALAAPGGGMFATQSSEVNLDQRYLDHINHTELATCLPAWRSVKIAVVDNGFDLEHPDIKAQIIDAYDEADKDENAQVPNYKKERNHGTKEAGIIWATHNDFWISWVFPDSDLILIKSTKDTANGRDVTDGIQAIAKAYEMGAEVINLSRWGYTNVPLLERITKKVASEWVKIIAAAWNYNKSAPFYPAAYDRVIWVWAIDKENQKASFSNYGPWVDISAPWVDMMTTDLDNSYNPYNGTSEASPVVAWSLALAMSHGLTWNDLLNNVDDFGTWVDNLGIWVIDLWFMCEQFEQNAQTDPDTAWHNAALEVHQEKVDNIILLIGMVTILMGVLTGMIYVLREGE